MRGFNSSSYIWTLNAFHLCFCLMPVLDVLKLSGFVTLGQSMCQ